MKSQLEASRSEALLIGQNIPALGGKITAVKKVQEHIRQITLEGGRTCNVPVTRIKAIVDATLRTQYAQKDATQSKTTMQQKSGYLSQKNANMQAMFAAHAKKK